MQNRPTLSKQLNDVLHHREARFICWEQQPNNKALDTTLSETYIEHRDKFFASLQRSNLSLQAKINLLKNSKYIHAPNQKMNFSMVIAYGNPRGASQYLQLLNNLLQNDVNPDDILVLLEKKLHNKDESFSMLFARYQKANILIEYIQLLSHLKSKLPQDERAPQKMGGLLCQAGLKDGMLINFIDLVISKHSGEVILAAIQSNLIPASEWVKSDSKEKVFSHIKALDAETRKAIFLDAYKNEESPLYQFFHEKRGSRETSEKRGLLKQIRLELVELGEKDLIAPSFGARLANSVHSFVSELRPQKQPLQDGEKTPQAWLEEGEGEELQPISKLGTL